MVESISNYQLEQLLRKVDRCQPVSLATITDPEMRKRGNPFAGIVRKVSFCTGFICWQYQRVVNRQRAREGRRADFEAQPRRWGQRIKGTPLVVHVTTGDGVTHHYLEMKMQRSHAHYFDRNTAERIDAEDLRPWFPSQREDNTQRVERPVILRDYRLDRIAEITVDGTRYAITPAVTELRTYFPGEAARTSAEPLTTMAAG